MRALKIGVVSVLATLGTWAGGPADATVEPLTKPPVSVVPAEMAPDVPMVQPVAFAKGYHIRNHPDSINQVHIYKSKDCTGDNTPAEGILYQGENAQSTAWESAGMWSDRQYSVVKVYSGSTGAWIVTRTHQWWECVRQYPTNSYLWVVKWK